MSLSALWSEALKLNMVFTSCWEPGGLALQAHGVRLHTACFSPRSGPRGGGEAVRTWRGGAYLSPSTTMMKILKSHCQKSEALT